MILFSGQGFSEWFCKLGECIECLAVPKCCKSRLISGDAPLSVDANVLVVSMSVGVSQDLYKFPVLWYFLTSFITSPSDQSGALKLDENICGESKNLVGSGNVSY